MEVPLSNTPQLGTPPRRITVNAELVRRLVADQFPQWAGLAVRVVADGGWDNWTFHLGSEMSARLPSAAEYALAVEKEHRWLPELAPRLPLPISTPLGKGDNRHIGRSGRGGERSYTIYSNILPYSCCLYPLLCPW